MMVFTCVSMRDQSARVHSAGLVTFLVTVLPRLRAHSRKTPQNTCEVLCLIINQFVCAAISHKSEQIRALQAGGRGFDSPRLHSSVTRQPRPYGWGCRVSVTASCGPPGRSRA